MKTDEVLNRAYQKCKAAFYTKYPYFLPSEFEPAYESTANRIQETMDAWKISDGFEFRDEIYRCLEHVRTNLQELPKEGPRLAKVEGEIEEMLWQDLRDICDFYFLIRKATDIVQDLRERVVAFRQLYFDKPEVKLLCNFQEALEELQQFKQPLTGLEKICINAGKRTYTFEKSGWGIVTYVIHQNGWKYTRPESTREVYEEETLFLACYILQKKYLFKLLITPKGSQLDQFVIKRDCEKISLVDGVELRITKHHGNELIFLESKQEAYDWQGELLKLREEGSGPRPRS